MGTAGWAKDSGQVSKLVGVLRPVNRYGYIRAR